MLRGGENLIRWSLTKYVKYSPTVFPGHLINNIQEVSFIKEQVIQSLTTINWAQPADPVPSLEVAVMPNCSNPLVALVSFSGKQLSS